MNVNNLVQNIKPWGRAIKYTSLQYLTKFRSRQEWLDNFNQKLLPIAFIIGCGRSGTTILGHILSLHPDVCYFFEPYHFWAAINPMTDFLNFYYKIDAYYLMNSSHWTEEAQMRFNRLFMNKWLNKKGKILIEKTPINTVRLGYINTLAPQAKFIHLVRDGVDVAYSISQLALHNNYKIKAKHNYNQWWGVNNYKWQAMVRDCTLAGYYPDEIPQLQDHSSKGAYEWLVNLKEVERWREDLVNRLLEITYTQLTTDSEKTLYKICDFLGLSQSETWIQQAIKKIQSNKQVLTRSIKLPPQICQSFNSYQENFNFHNKAIT